MTTYAPCSCGITDCPELGWPHEWDPIAAGDSCSAGQPPAIFTCSLQQLLSGWQPPVHKVTEPYVRYGSGYACVECAEIDQGIA